MIPLVTRIAALILGERVFRRVAQHPRLAPILGTRRGRLALLVLGFGLGRHPRTRAVGRAVGLARRWSRIR